jgi:enoyl-CoA hydratase/carnithine racemase
MPTKPLLPVACYRGTGDLSRGRQIAASWKLLDRFAPEDAEVVAKAIAQGIAEGRANGLEIALGRLSGGATADQADEKATKQEV